MSSALKWKLALGFFLVFLAGATVGSLAGNWGRHSFHFRSAHAGEIAQRMTERFRTELSLTPEQTAKIAPIIEANARKLEAIRMETGRRVRQTFVETHQEISPHLTPEQRTKLAAMEERHRRREGRRHRDFREAPSPATAESSPAP